MKLKFPVLALIFCFGLAAVAMAQETPPPAKEEPAAKEPAKTEPAKEAPAAPAEKAAPEAAKELSLCAKALVPVAESYKKAYDDMQKWIAEVDARTAAGNEKIVKVQEQIQQNETASTKAKLDGDDAKVKELSKANKQLWADLEAAKKGQSAACSGIDKEAAQRVKQYAAETNTALEECKARMK